MSDYHAVMIPLLLALPTIQLYTPSSKTLLVQSMEHMPAPPWPPRGRQLTTEKGFTHKIALFAATSTSNSCMSSMAGKGPWPMHQSTTMLTQQASQSLPANTTSLTPATRFVLSSWCHTMVHSIIYLNGSVHE